MKKIKLINLRKAKKVSQVNIATYLKISQTQYQKRESGKIKISNIEWEKIAYLLNVAVDDIYEGYISDEKNIMEEIILLKEKIKILEQKITSNSK